MSLTARLTAAVFILSLIPSVRAADPLPRSELDARIVRALGEAIDIGAPVFNAGDPSGCYRLYQGALLAVTPLLDDRPELRSSVQQKVNRAQAARSVADRAFILREALDEIRMVLAKDQSKAMAGRSLWERLGGEPAAKAVVHDFVQAAAPDPKVNFTRGGRFALDAGGVAKLEQRLVELVSAVSGGPLKYTGRGMAEAHAGMAITDAEFDALAGHLVATLKKYNVPPKEIDELVGIVAATRKEIVGK